MLPTTRVLIADDDVAIQRMLIAYFEGQGFAAKAVSTGAQLRSSIDEDLPDIVLLDLRLPGEDGLSLARFLRERYDVAIVMIAGAGDVMDRIIALEVGADDFVAKPFEPRELLARMKSVLRRMQAQEQPTTEPVAESSPTAPASRKRFGRCEVALDSRQLFDMSEGGLEVPMTAMEYELIRVFLANPNRLLSRDQLLMKTRNRTWEPLDRSIDIRIGRLRRKVELEPGGEPRCIRTVRSGGYMYVPE